MNTSLNNCEGGYLITGSFSWYTRDHDDLGCFFFDLKLNKIVPASLLLYGKPKDEHPKE